MICLPGDKKGWLLNANGVAEYGYKKMNKM
jgi:hypothetical protein